MSLKYLSNHNHIDLRSETEFHKGTIPGSVNIPILSNNEYEAVGKKYKDKGQSAAIELGMRLVNGDLKKKRIKLWKNHISKNPGCFIFCYRGGLRSKVAQEWLAKDDIQVERIAAGYKEFRSSIIAEHTNSKKYKKHWTIIGGLTGSGKTILLNKFKESIDLEDIANHRGSAFGRHNTPQPSQANFENNLTSEYLNHSFSNIFLEDESRSIGSVTLPGPWYEKMQTSNLVVMKVNTEERVNNIIDEYILKVKNNSISGHELLTKYLASLEKIKKRLGDKAHKEISSQMINGFSRDDIKSHEEWISRLLTGYYDPMYKYKLELRKDYIIHIGDYKTCMDYLSSCK